MNQIQSQISYLGSEELKELLNNDDELDKRVDDAVSISHHRQPFVVSILSHFLSLKGEIFGRGKGNFDGSESINCRRKYCSRTEND